MSAQYLLKRIVTILFTLFIVSVLVFGITQVLPGDAAAMLLGENATAEQLAALRERLGNDEETERAVVRAELLKITHLRLAKLLERP